ncbi:MAG TPA: TlpA disulfide reductase family protein [Vicinamibacterales bacterium]|nr:TlpA disulfide reductase family protein [Vicinamibacterales bacterium]
MTSQRTLLLTTGIVIIMTVFAAAQSGGREQLTKGKTLWDQRLSKSAIVALEEATKNPATAAEAYEALGRMYTFKGWQQEGAFPGWHDEPAYRERALAALRAAVKADPSRQSARDALKTAEGFAAADKVDPAPTRPEILALDAKLDALRGAANAKPADISAAVAARAKAQADAQPYFVGADILNAFTEYDKAIEMAEQGSKVSDRFIDENLSAYQLPGKAQASRDRTRSVVADLVGWALVEKKNYASGAAKLHEAERLSQRQDFIPLFHLAELSRVQNEPAKAREYYLDALSLAGGPPQLRQRIMPALTSVRGDAGPGLPLIKWVETEMANRREQRKATALKSLVDRPLPALALTTVEGLPYDTKNLRGKVVLLDFFASWCGICKAELPQLKTSYAKYQNNPNVVYLLVSIDEDSHRLQRFLGDMKFPFPVARAKPEDMEKAMGFDNVPATFYVDKKGIVRYQVIGTDSFGDSPTRVGWYVDQLLK